MGVFIESSVVSCDRAMIFSLFWDQKYLVLSDWSVLISLNLFPLQMLISFSAPSFPCIV